MIMPSPGAPTARPAASARRRSGALRDRPPVVWLLLGLVLALLHPWFPGLGWAAIHAVLLGALTHSILVWSSYFAEALLRETPSDARRRRQDQRIIGHIVGTSLVIVGVTWALWPLTLVGATLVGLAVIWHGVALWRRLRHALPGRFRIAVHYYLAASACLPVGATFGVLLARGSDGDVEGRLLLAHSLTMVLGWAGLTVWGTLLTLWPTMLSSPLDDRAERLARQALPAFGIALAGLVTAALLGSRWWTLVGLVAYAVALAWWGRALLRPARATSVWHASAWSAVAALGWFAATLIVVGVHLAATSSWTRMDRGYGRIAIAITAGFAAQILIGALSHLVPVVLGGGTGAWRAAQVHLDRFAVARISAANLGLMMWLVPSAPAVHVVGAVICLVALGAFLPIMMLAIHAAVRAKRVGLADDDVTPPPSEQGIWSAGQFVAALTVAVVGASLGVAWNPAAVGVSDARGAAAAVVGVAPTGRTTTVTVEAADMRFSPNRISVPVGNRLVIDLRNTDPSTTHDLVLDTGADSGRLSPGQHTSLDVGVVTGNIGGWCSVPGHRQMGMTLTIVALGAPRPAVSATSAGDPATTPATASADPDVPASFAAADASLPRIGTGTVHRVTIAVEEKVLEVAPGVWQKRWTYNGTVPGPTLHGRVGDTFVVSLVNHTTMGHSIDFHAGTLAPDTPMRTVAPGHSLTYTFTAHRAGIWLYHCSTAPISVHIAAGMHGAVIIDPPGLSPVSASFVIQQDAVYVAGTGRTDIREVDADAVRDQRPTFYTFNGVAFQYDHRPLVVRAGERIRVWVINAGPDGVMDFHVVGGQFDTVYKEGGYLLKNGRDGFGDSSGGSQALALEPGQGGFVELTLPEAGHYPFVTHIMADAERGAHGVLTALPAVASPTTPGR